MLNFFSAFTNNRKFKDFNDSNWLEIAFFITKIKLFPRFFIKLYNKKCHLPVIKCGLTVIICGKKLKSRYKKSVKKDFALRRRDNSTRSNSDKMRLEIKDDSDKDPLT
ncbi:hypothetical protein BpHYR1_011497 [Brachionus plicatilis]|uniref:Uncharacterized protein n=1 Tax=Brachionus plicatilis TaxID=10195 RepID=A0A3M7S4T9_BRAPC|nr:hypothetical protein BpHYR1_011497 [Brachionus plicatilis]